jgi:hypothetical protein
MNTPIEKQAELLAELWLDYRDEEYFKEFFEYADLGFPLSYLLANNIVTRNTETDKFVGDTWELLLGLVALEDTGFDSLEDILSGTDFQDSED